MTSNDECPLLTPNSPPRRPKPHHRDSRGSGKTNAEGRAAVFLFVLWVPGAPTNDAQLAISGVQPGGVGGRAGVIRIVAILMGIAYAIRVPAEEPVLQGHFGNDWETYTRRVRWRMAPGLCRGGRETAYLQNARFFM